MWYILITRSRSEKKVAKQLSDAGYTVYLPLVKVKHAWKDRNKVIEEPLFPSYLFIQCTLERRNGVFISSGVIKYLQWGSKPLSLPDAEVERIKRACEYGGPIHVEKSDYQVGEEVKITSGYFRGVSGNINEVKSKGRLSIAIRSLSCAITIELNEEEVKHLLPTSPT